MTPIALRRPGMIYARGILMPDAARWLSRRRLLAVWKNPTWIHLLSLPDFLAATQATIENPDATGIYNLGDDGPLTLQEFLDRAAVERWGRLMALAPGTPPLAGPPGAFTPPPPSPKPSPPSSTPAPRSPGTSSASAWRPTRPIPRA